MLLVINKKNASRKAGLCLGWGKQRMLTDFRWETSSTQKTKRGWNLREIACVSGRWMELCLRAMEGFYISRIEVPESSSTVFNFCVF